MELVNSKRLIYTASHVTTQLTDEEQRELESTPGGAFRKAHLFRLLGITTPELDPIHALIATAMAEDERPVGVAGASADEATANAAAPVVAEVGSLFLLKLKDGIEGRDLPEMYKEIDYTKYSLEIPGPALPLPRDWKGVPEAPESVVYLGVIECL